MALDYGVLKGPVVDFGREDDNFSPHYQIVVSVGPVRWRIPVNVRSKDGSEVLFAKVDPFSGHPILDRVLESPDGFRPFANHRPGLALDYVREPLFDASQLTALPHSVGGENNDLQDFIEVYVRQAKQKPNARLFAFGARFSVGDPRPADHKFRTTMGVHDIHMNQGNPTGPFSQDNGVFQDGGLLFDFGEERRAGVFLAFQSQHWQTDDRGRPVPGSRPGVPGSGIFDPFEPPEVTIVAALANPEGHDAGRETVTLLNTSERQVNINNWKIIGSTEGREVLSGSIEAGETRLIRLTGLGAVLSNNGGKILLFDKDDRQVDAVSFSREQAKKQGRTIVF